MAPNERFFGTRNHAHQRYRRHPIPSHRSHGGMKRDGDSSHIHTNGVPFTIKRRRTNTHNFSLDRNERTTNARPERRNEHDTNRWQHQKYKTKNRSDHRSSSYVDRPQKNSVENPREKNACCTGTATVPQTNKELPPNAWEHRGRTGNEEDDDKDGSKPTTTEPVNNVGDLPKLDPSNSDHFHKIQKRRKMVSYGKNTIGYDEYLKQIPKHRRKPRCPAHPVTPDATRDIPWKRFHGLVKAWRKSLHMYDPPDLLPEQPTVSSAKVATIKNATSADTQQRNGNPVPQSREEIEICDAVRRGLQVDFNTGGDPLPSTTAVATPSTPTMSVAGELDRLEIKSAEAQKNPRFTWYLSSDEENDDDINMAEDVTNDSDDDLL